MAVIEPEDARLLRAIADHHQHEDACWESWVPELRRIADRIDPPPIDYDLTYRAPVTVKVRDGEVLAVIVGDEEIVLDDPAIVVENGVVIRERSEPDALAAFDAAEESDWPGWQFG